MSGEEVQYNLDKRTQRLVDAAEFKNALAVLRAKVLVRSSLLLLLAPSSFSPLLRAMPLFKPRFAYCSVWSCSLTPLSDGITGQLLCRSQQKGPPSCNRGQKVSNIVRGMSCVWRSTSSNM